MNRKPDTKEEITNNRLTLYAITIYDTNPFQKVQFISNGKQNYPTAAMKSSQAWQLNLADIQAP